MIFKEDLIRTAFDKKGYKFFIEPYSINIFGVRMDLNTNQYDDFICVAFYDKRGYFINVTFTATVDPGFHWLTNPMREEGCAILVPGQYREVYAVGPHGSTRYEACRQVGNMKVYRDNNKDKRHDLDPKTIEEGNFLTNIHHGWNSKIVERNSAGCQVIQRKDYFEEEFMPLVKKSTALYGPKFTYTLFDKEDIEE